MNVVLSGIFYPVAILRYFEAALKRRSGVTLFTVGPYTGQWIPWSNGTAGGMNLPAKYAKAPDLPLPFNNASGIPALPVGYIEAKLPWKPDLWLQIDAGFYFRGKPGNGKNVIVGTDPHCLNYDPQRNLADTFYCMQGPYAKPGDKYLAYGYDPIYHAPEPQAKEYDVCLIGLHYANRDKLVGALRSKGLTVYYDLGPAFDEARSLYNAAPIGLNWSSRLDLTARVFELLGMQRLAVVNNVPDLNRFFVDGDHLITFETLDQAVEKVMYYRANPHEAERIAAAGHRRVQPHTWDARVSEILSDV